MNINLDNLSDSNKARIMQILEEEKSNVKNDAIKRVSPNEAELKDFFRQNINNPKSNNNYIISGSTSLNNMESIDLDTGQKFEDDFNRMGSVDGYKMQQRRLKGILSSDDKETYRSLNIIHENGVANFWSKVKNVVDKKQDIDINDCSDKLSVKDIWG